MEFTPSGKTSLIRVFNYDNQDRKIVINVDNSFPLRPLMQRMITEIEDMKSIDLSKVVFRVQVPNEENLNEEEKIIYLDGGDRVGDYVVNQELPTEFSYEILIGKKGKGGKGKKSTISDEDKLNIMRYVAVVNDEDSTSTQQAEAIRWLTTNAAESNNMYKKIMEYLNYRAEKARRDGENASDWTQFKLDVDNWVDQYNQDFRYALAKQREVIDESDIVDFDLVQDENGVWNVKVSEAAEEEVRQAYRYIKEFETKYAELFKPNTISKALSKLDLVRASSDTEDEEENHLLAFDELIERYDEEEQADIEEKIYIIYAIFITAAKPLTKTQVNDKWKTIFTRMSKYDRELLSEVLLSDDFKKTKKGFALTADAIVSLAKDGEFKSYLNYISEHIIASPDQEEEQEDRVTAKDIQEDTESGEKQDQDENDKDIPATAPLILPAQDDVEENDIVTEEDDLVNTVQETEDADAEPNFKEIVEQLIKDDDEDVVDTEPQKQTEEEYNADEAVRIFVEDNVAAAVESGNPLLDNFAKKIHDCRLYRALYNTTLIEKLTELLKSGKGQFKTASDRNMAFSLLNNAIFVVSNDNLPDVISKDVRRRIAMMFVQVAQSGTSLDIVNKMNDDLSEEEKSIVEEFKNSVGSPSRIEVITTYLNEIEGLEFFSEEYFETLSGILAEINSLEPGLLPGIENISYSAVMPTKDQLESGLSTDIGVEDLASSSVAEMETTDPSKVRKQIEEIEFNEDAPDEDEIDE
jgi:hypothetical protein